MAGLLKADMEGLAQPVDIMPHSARFFPKAPIGHQDRACRIVCEADRQQLARGGCAQFRALYDFADFAAQRGCGQLVGQLEATAFCRLALVDHQMPHLRVEIAQAGMLRIDERNRKCAADMLLERRDIWSQL